MGRIIDKNTRIIESIKTRVSILKVNVSVVTKTLFCYIITFLNRFPTFISV